MARISNPFRYMFKQRYENTSSVFKCWFGKKFFIWKGKSLLQAVNVISIELDQRIRLGLKPNDPFEKVVKHILKSRVTYFEVEAVVQTDNPAELLIAEYDLLKQNMANPDCLNVEWFPIIPKWIQESAKDEFRAYVDKVNQPQRRVKIVTKRPAKKKALKKKK
jgi:hypothetical protein